MTIVTKMTTHGQRRTINESADTRDFTLIPLLPLDAYDPPGETDALGARLKVRYSFVEGTIQLANTGWARQVARI
jgi:hypothetical protein